MLVLKLRVLPTNLVRGDYTINGLPNKMPARALFMHPDVADSFLADIAPHIGVSDILRSAESSLNAVETGRGAQPPSKSGHNFGFSIDLRDVSEAIKDVGLKNKTEFDAWMEARGWFCHRRDHKMGSEEWHYNYLRLMEKLGFGVLKPAGSFTSDELELMIQAVYGPQLKPNDLECQGLLKKLHLYSGALDNDLGPLSLKAIEVFQRGWGLKVDRLLGPITRRTLAFVACDRVLV